MTPLKIRQVLSCAIAGMSYMAIYLLRKPLGVVKADLETTYKLTKNQLGWMDTSFFLPYAITQITCGNVGDKYGARNTIIFNLVVTSLSMVSFGFWNSPVVLCILLFISGISQATLWPNCVRCISDWFPTDQLATVFGILGSMLFGGGILGTTLAVYLQQLYAPDLRMIFMVPSIIGFIMAAIVYFLLKTPEECMMIIDGKISKPASKVEDGEPKGLTLLETWKIPLVPELSFTMLGIKLVRYCLYMWLPLYLYQNLKYDKATAGYLSNAFEIGCVVGATTSGYIIDKFMGGRKHWSVCYAIFASAASLLLFQWTSLFGLVFNFLFLFFVGFFQAGPDLIVTGAIAVDVGKKYNASSAVSGITNGFGSLGSIVQGPLIALVVTQFGWGGSFYGMIVLTVLGGVAICKAAIMNDKTGYSELSQDIV